MLPRTFLLSEERTHVETNFSSNQDIIFKRSPIGQELLQGKEAVYALERKGVFFFFHRSFPLLWYTLNPALIFGMQDVLVNSGVICAEHFTI